MLHGRLARQAEGPLLSRGDVNTFRLHIQGEEPRAPFEVHDAHPTSSKGTRLRHVC